MGTYTLTGEFNPGLELCDACCAEINAESNIDSSKYQTVDYGQIAQQAGWGDSATVQQTLRILLQTIKYVLNKKWF